MFAVAMRILNHREEAEDCLHDCFIDAFDKLDSFRAESGFGSWMKRIVMNRAINLMKKKKVRLIDIDQAEVLIEEEEENELPFFNPEEIKTAVQKLSDGYRTIFTLYMFEDVPHKEIAGLLGISESTSKSQLNRAKKQLKSVLLSYEEQ